MELKKEKRIVIVTTEDHMNRAEYLIKHELPTTEIVTYVVSDDNNHRYYVDDYAPEDYHDINSTICFPVYVKAYNRKNGEPSYTLNIQKPDVSRGEHF